MECTTSSKFDITLDLDHTVYIVYLDFDLAIW